MHEYREIEKEFGQRGDDIVKTIYYAKGLYIACSVILCAVGVMFIACPDTALRLLCICLGVSMLIFAGAKIVGYYSKDPYGLAFQFDLSLGIVVGVLGVAFLLHRQMVLNTVIAIVGLFVLIDGAFKFQTAFDARRFGMRAWWIIMLGAILTAAAAAICIFFPEAAAQTTTSIIGIALIVDGVQNLYNTLYTVRTLEKQRKERFVSVLDDEI